MKNLKKNQYIRNYMCLPHFEHPLSVGETAEKPSQVQIGPEIVQCNTIQILYYLSTSKTE